MRSEACTRARALIPFYLEGEVQPIEALETASHISKCPTCATESARGRKVIESMRTLRTPAPPRDIADGVLGLLRSMREGMSVRRGLKWSALGIFGAGALLSTLVAQPTPGVTNVGFLTRLGEILLLDRFFDRIVDLFSGIVPPTTGILEAISAGGAAAQGGTAALPPHMLAPLAFLASAFVVALLSSCTVLGGLLVMRLRTARRKPPQPF